MGGFNFWCRSRDSDPRPSDYKSEALPAELDRQRTAYITLLIFKYQAQKS